MPIANPAQSAARAHRCSIVVAKVDRLTRSVAFLSRLLEAGVDVRFSDLPMIEGPTGRFMLQQMASVAELEAGLISRRTRDALAAAKAKLGGFRGCKLTLEAMAAGRARQVEIAHARAADLAAVVSQAQKAGATSLREIASTLNERGIPTPRGAGAWSATQVSRLLAKITATILLSGTRIIPLGITDGKGHKA